jgi:competence protein ComEA
MMAERRWSRIVSVVVIVMLALSGATWAAEEGKININKAPAKELMKLQGVGEAIAARIIEYRKANGPFKTPEDIMKVKGVGQKTFDENKARIVVK